MSSADDQYQQRNDLLPTDVPAGDSMDNDYTSRVGQKTAEVPVQADTDAVKDPIDPATADSDETLSMLHSLSPVSEQALPAYTSSEKMAMAG